MRTEIRDPVRSLSDLTHDYDGEALRLFAEDAHGFEGIFSGMLDWYLVTLNDTETTEIEAAKTKLKTALDGLVETLSEAHWSDHNDQHDDDYDGHHFSDEEWADILRKGEEAKTGAANKLSTVRAVLSELETVQKRWTDSLRLQIAELDRSIATGLKTATKNFG